MRVFLLCAALTSFGCGSFGSQHGTWNASKQDSTASGKETFDLKASVSAPTDFEVKGSTITWRLPNGSPPPRDMGSAYTAPLPRHPAEELDVKQVAGRGQFKLVERPTAANDWTLRVALGAPDSSGQEYHLQFSWKSDGAAIVKTTRKHFCRHRHDDCAPVMSSVSRFHCPA